MNVLILSGGTGSVALQTGLYKKFGNNLDVTVLLNQYDNGLSTGAVRQVFDGKILGPSDLRKNQLLSHEIRYGKTELLKVLEERFTRTRAKVSKYCFKQIESLPEEYVDAKQIMYAALGFYFDSPKWRSIKYEDFSISNIIYAALAAMNNNSMTEAGSIMAKVLNIPDTVINNSDESVFLRARTEAGRTLFDEADIVDWNNADKITSIFFIDCYGDETAGPDLSTTALSAIAGADIIIFSSGTQWSSLIPTYVSGGFREAIDSSLAKKYLIMNNTPDKDMPNVGSDGIYSLLKDYLPVDDITFILNNMTMNMMNAVHDGMKFISGSLNHGLNECKHDPELLADCVFADYYRDYFDSDVYVFDYDDTISSRHSECETSKMNKKLVAYLHSKTPCVICTGNTPKSVAPIAAGITVYADGGMVEYSTVPAIVHRTKTAYADPGKLIHKYIGELNPDFAFSPSELKKCIRIILNAGILSSKISVRTSAMIAIKPIDDEYRKTIETLLRILFGDKYRVRISGTSTIEITKPNSGKQDAVNKVLSNYKNVVYVGDEFYEGGNDECIKDIKGVKIIEVKSPKDTAVFLLSILEINIDSVDILYHRAMY